MTPVEGRAEAEQAAVAAVEAFYQAWSEGDIEALRETMNYPHVSLFPGHIEVRATPADFESPFERLREGQGWHRSSLDRLHVIWTRDDKVCVDAHWSRYGEDGTRYLSGNIIYLVTRVDGHWGIQFRARSEPRDHDGPPQEPTAGRSRRSAMLTLVAEEIEEYARQHTTALPPHLAELARFTLEEMEYGLMLSGPIEGGLLQFLVWASGARRVLEIGCFTGFSAQMMAAALPEDGELITCELDPETAEIARTYADQGPDGHKIEIRDRPRRGDAQDPRWPLRPRVHRRRQGAVRGLLRGGDEAALRARDHRGGQRAAERTRAESGVPLRQHDGRLQRACRLGPAGASR